MKIRPEAREIMIAFGSPSAELGTQVRETALNLIGSLDAFDSVAWQPLPLTSPAQAYASANARVASSDPNFSVSNAMVNYLADTPPAPLAPEWRMPLLSAVGEASESYFTSARIDLKRGDTVSGTENLCHAANWVVIGQAALHGWPHATEEDDINAVVALATGTLPQSADELYNLLQQAPKDGVDLSSNHGDVKSVHQAARQ